MMTPYFVSPPEEGDTYTPPFNADTSVQRPSSFNGTFFLKHL